MRDGVSIQVSLAGPKFAGETLPSWISEIKGHPNVLDASAVLRVSDNGERSLRVAVVNRSETNSYNVALRVAFETVLQREVEAHELWHRNAMAKNGWGKENGVAVKTKTAPWMGSWVFREHSFTLLIIHLD